MINKFENKYNINDKVYGIKEHRGDSGTILSFKIIKLPFRVKAIVLYNVKLSDDTTLWINECYLKLLESKIQGDSIE